MLVCSIIDPVALEQLDAASETQCVQFLRAICINGVCLSDPFNIVLKPLKAAALANKQIETLLLRVISSYTIERPTPSARAVAETVVRLCRENRPDLIITKRPNADLQSVAIADSVRTLSDYHLSTAEQYRLQCCESLPPMDQEGEAKFQNHIRRTVKYSKTLKFYDPFFAGGPKGEKPNTSHFERGLAFVLTEWHSSLGSDFTKADVELVTVEPKEEVAENRLISMVKKLQLQFPIMFRIRFTKDVFHARHLETRNFAVQLDPGFDFFTPEGNLKSVFLKSARNDRGYLTQIRSSAQRPVMAFAPANR